jgi:hypothetical protein
MLTRTLLVFKTGLFYPTHRDRRSGLTDDLRRIGEIANSGGR